MPLYEHVFLARQDASAQQVDELTTHLKGVIERMGGAVEKVENWGVRSLTYRIAKIRKAHFVLLNLNAPPANCNACLCGAPQGQVCTPPSLINVLDCPCGGQPTVPLPLTMPAGCVIAATAASSRSAQFKLCLPD